MLYAGSFLGAACLRRFKAALALREIRGWVLRAGQSGSRPGVVSVLTAFSALTALAALLGAGHARHSSPTRKTGLCSRTPCYPRRRFVFPSTRDISSEHRPASARDGATKTQCGENPAEQRDRPTPG